MSVQAFRANGFAWSYLDGFRLHTPDFIELVLNLTFRLRFFALSFHLLLPLNKFIVLFFA